jgi:hypothetical protein
MNVKGQHSLSVIKRQAVKAYEGVEVYSLTHSQPRN